MTILFFALDYFQEKLTTKFFKKFKKLYFGAILNPFCPNLGKNEFSWRKGLCQFLVDIPSIYHRPKNQKKLMTYSGGKCRTDGWTERLTLTERQTDNSDFVGTSIGRCPNYSPKVRLVKFT